MEYLIEGACSLALATIKLSFVIWPSSSRFLVYPCIVWGIGQSNQRSSWDTPNSCKGDLANICAIKCSAGATFHLLDRFEYAIHGIKPQSLTAILPWYVTRKGPAAHLFSIPREKISPIVFIRARKSPWVSREVLLGPNNSLEEEADWWDTIPCSSTFHTGRNEN